MVKINDGDPSLVERDFITEFFSCVAQITSHKFVYQAYLRIGFHKLGTHVHRRT